MKNYSILCLIIVGIFSFSSELFAITPPQNPIGFVENKGQIVDQELQPNEEVLFLLNTPGLNVQLRENGFSYDTYSIKSDAGTIVTGAMENKENIHNNYEYHRIDIDLMGANRFIRAEATGVLPGYLNYCTPGVAEGGVNGVRTFTSVRYSDVYNGIDLEFLVEDGKFKYNFIVHPWGNVEDIRLKIRNANSLGLRSDGTLEMQTANGTILEQIPLTYYIENGVQKMAQGNYRIQNGSEVGFVIIGGGSGDLVIDPIPELEKYTYYGGDQEDAISRLALDSQGNILGFGQTESPVYIATSGSFQSIYQAFNDLFLVKLSSDLGTRYWATYIGSPLGESPAAIAVDLADNILITGSGRDAIGGFGTTGTHNASHQGVEIKTFIGRFQSNGALDWGTYYGSDVSLEPTVARSMVLADSNHIYLTGYTWSKTGIAYNTTHMDSLFGTGDCFLASFDGTGNLHWSTYVGGEDYEEATSLILNTKGRLLMAGSTSSSSHISTTGVYQTQLSPNVFGLSPSDAFVMEFDTSGSKIWGSYYGDVGRDGIISMAGDSLDNIYIMGSTKSPGYFGTPGAEYEMVDTGTTCSGFLGYSFVSRLNSTGHMVWSTYLDFHYNYTPIKVNYNKDRQSIEFIGWAQCCNTMTNCMGSLAGTGWSSMSQNEGKGYMLEIDGGFGTYKWASFIGQSGNSDENLVLDILSRSDHFYIAGTSNDNFWFNYATVNQRGFQASKRNREDGFIAKMNYGCADLCDSLDCYSFKGDTLLCLSEDSTTSLSLDFAHPGDKMFGADHYQWTVQPGATIVGGQGTKTVQLHLDSAGVIQLSVQGFSDCDTSIVATQMIHISPAIDTVKLNLSDTVYVCQGDDVTLRATKPFDFYDWADGSNDSVVITGETGVHWVRAGNLACRSYSDTVYVFEVQLPAAPVINWDIVNQEFVSSVASGNQWYRNDTLIVGAVNQTYMPLKSGLFKAIVTDSGCTSLFSNQLPYFLSVEEYNSEGVEVYPNPVSRELNLEVISGYGRIEAVRIIDVGGSLLIDQKMPKGGVLNTVIDLGGVPAGIYLLEYKAGNTIRHVRFSKSGF